MIAFRAEEVAMIIVGCLLVGIGVGMFLDEAGIGTLIGLGVGFLFTGLFGEREPFMRYTRRRRGSPTD